MKRYTYLTNFIRYLWATPCTLLGLLLALVAFWGGASVCGRYGVLEISGGRFASWLSGRRSSRTKLYAFALGHVIFGINHTALSLHRSHEHVHIRQYERWGIFFIPLYCASSLMQWFCGRDPYLDNCFEREACSQITKLK